MIETIIEKEHDARQMLIQKKPDTLWDQIGRAYGILTYAHAMSSKEALNLLSIIKLGVDLGAFQKIAACRSTSSSSRRSLRIFRRVPNKS